MADLDPIETEIIRVAQPGDTVVIVETPPPSVPANRPRKVYAGLWGQWEIAAVAIGSMVLLFSVIVYFFWVVPSNQELARNQAEAARLDDELVSARSRYGEITNTETEVARIISSIDDFETRFLPVVSTGQSALYQRINGLISAYGLLNTAGPDYAPLETADLATSTQQSEEDRGRSKFRSLYPGVYVTTTVEGPYQNIRRFIREIETGREFIIVSAVELAPSETDQRTEQPSQVVNVPATRPNAPAQNPNGFGPALPNQAPVRPRPKGKTHGEIVSLRIEMAAYFRRPQALEVAQ